MFACFLKRRNKLSLTTGMAKMKAEENADLCSWLMAAELLSCYLAGSEQLPAIMNSLPCSCCMEDENTVALTLVFSLVTKCLSLSLEVAD